MNRAQYRWQLADRDGVVLDVPVSPVFTSRFDAEQWLGEHWRGLAQDRVATAGLLRGEEPLGRPVALSDV
jgi:hypothetical protein